MEIDKQASVRASNQYFFLQLLEILLPMLHNPGFRCLEYSGFQPLQRRGRPICFTITLQAHLHLVEAGILSLLFTLLVPCTTSTERERDEEAKGKRKIKNGKEKRDLHPLTSRFSAHTYLLRRKETTTQDQQQRGPYSQDPPHEVLGLSHQSKGKGKRI